MKVATIGLLGLVLFAFTLAGCDSCDNCDEGAEPIDTDSMADTGEDTGQDTGEDTGEDTGLPADLDQLPGGVFELVVDRVAEQPDVALPGDLLEETDYTIVSDRPRYQVVFGADMGSVSINPGNTIGQAVTNDTYEVYFEFLSGEIDNGRFIVWVEGLEFQAEFTEYGSGVPIITSGRGLLAP